MSGIRKKFVNEPENVVNDSLKGLVQSDNRIQFHPQNPRVVLRKDYEDLKSNGKVTLGCGGGSGHEPFAAGLVGKNSLTAAIAGDVFASPPSSHVSDALEAIQGKAGSLIYVINYTGDRLHFGMAIERSKAKLGPDTKADLVYIDDDVALENKLGVTVGGRGLAGALLVLQIAGVLAEDRKAKFEEIRDISRDVIANMGTFGVSLYPCALPGKGLMFDLPAGEMELGLGIHGEPGVERTKQTSAKEIVATVLEKLTASKRLQLKKTDKLAVLVNNLGGVSNLEFGIVQGEVAAWFAQNGYKIGRFLTGTLMTSVDGHGFSITVLRLKSDDWASLLDTPSHISSLWKATTPQDEVVKPPQHSQFDDNTKVELVGAKVDEATSKAIEKSLRKACEELIKNEDLLNQLDSTCGDGDCGNALKSASKAILEAADQKRLAFQNPKSLCLQLSKLCEHSVGGTSGALYALFFGAGSRAFESTFDSKSLREAIKQGLEAISYYGHAKPGHRTLVDPLSAAAEAAENASWPDLISTVEKAAEATATMEAKSGRASYTNKDQQKQPDPGAKAVALWFRAAFDATQ
ncbi:unnamed protein product [Bursaphelenchus xylophilus]|uniref:Triokinase/FMN cyclase n=1 Tax=Bursaphelenchus xylophilus TaxID=6326 RepID=A0A1I7RTS2_BURXY|nr:unnamed protein product [Bursaphelenchus xylophilus]CAG9122168.1 unnamed protein product [Bursaphelenchus xylophilus]